MAATEPGTGADQQHSTPPPEAVRRADAILSDVGAHVGRWAARLQHDAARLTARTREELEDMWVEAQSLRRREHGPGSAAGDAAATPGESGQPMAAERAGDGSAATH